MSKFFGTAILGSLLLVGASAVASQLRPVQVDVNHGFVDIDLPISDVLSAKGVTRIIARGTLDGASVGFEIDFPQKDNGDSALPHPLSVGAARLRRLGPESDRFVAYLSRHYALPGGPKIMVPSVDASAVGLGDDLHGKKDMKFFFFDNGPEDRYAEVYINIDFDRRVLEFHEKDPDYRKPLLLALARAP